MQYTLAKALGPVYMNAFSSKTISVSVKKQRLHCIYTLFSYRFYIVRFGDRFSKVTVFSHVRVDAKWKRKEKFAVSTKTIWKRIPVDGVLES